MKFEDVLPGLRRHAKVRRACWSPRRRYIARNPHSRHIEATWEGGIELWIPTQADILGDDWEVVK